MASSVYFNGELITIPGAYSMTDASGMSIKGDNDGAKIIAFVGESLGGEPATVQFFSEPTSAKKVLKGGELLKACEKAWNPVSKTKEGVKLGGANVIACIRSNKATKSVLEIAGKEGSDKPQVKFVSTDWGENTAHQLKMSNGNLSRTKKLVIYDQNAGTYENYNDIGNVFTISYTGTQQYAELNIFKDSVTSVMYLQTKIGATKDDCIEDLKIKLDKTVLKSIKALAQQIASYENYHVDTSDKYNNKLIVTDLDFVTGQSIITPQDGEAFRVTAVYADLQKKLAAGSQLVNVESYDKTCGEIKNFEYTGMTGGKAGISPASWVEYFDMLSNFDITYIVPLVSDTAIHAELLSHVTTLSGSMGRERRGIVGGDCYETVADVIIRARDMASDRIQVVHGGFWDYNAQNELELYPPYILAAQHAGRAAFLEDGESATRDVYRMTSPEYKLERSEITQLLDNGVLAFEFVLGKNSLNQSYVRLVQDLTTDVTSKDTIHTERATGALADSLNKEIRESLDDLLTGKRTTSSDLTSAKNKVLSILFQRKKNKHIIDYKDVYVSKTGTVTTVEYSVAPAEPNNFTLITGHYYTESISADGSSGTGGKGVSGAAVM